MGGSLDQLFRNRIRLVFALALLVLNHAALQIERFFTDGEVSHAIGFGEQREIDRRLGDVFEVVGAVLLSGAVEVRSADLFHAFDVPALEIVAAAEHEVFKQVGEAGLTGLFILRAHVVPHVDRHNGRFVVFVDQNSQTVVENNLLVRDIDNLRGKSGRQSHAAQCHRFKHPKTPCEKLAKPALA